MSRHTPSASMLVWALLFCFGKAATAAPPLIAAPPGTLGSLSGTVGVRLEFLPVHLIESEAPHVPSLLAMLRMDLNDSFAAHFRYVGVVVKNQFEMGMSWSTSLIGLSCGAQYHGGIRFGALEGSGFNASTWSWIHHPGVRVSVPWRDSSFTLQGELTFGGNQHFKLGEFKSTNEIKFPFEGAHLSLLVESPLGRNAHLLYGASLIWSTPYDQAWLVFSDENERALYPQLVVGYEF